MIVNIDNPERRQETHSIGVLAGFVWGQLTGKSLCRGLILGIAVLLLTITNSRIADAQSSDIFTVANIRVDKTAASATAARKQALAEGEILAFNKLLRRLTLRQDRQRLPKLSGEEISGYVQNFAVANEKNSAVRYLADLTFRFKSDEIRGLLRDSEVEFAETRSKPALMLPVYQVAGAVSLWDDPNPWRTAWSERLKFDGLAPLVFAKGDLTDISMIGAELAVKGDTQRLMAIAKRYRLSSVLVAKGTLVSTSKGVPGLQITVDRYGAGKNSQIVKAEIPSRIGEGIDDLLLRAAEDVAHLIEDQWKTDNLLQFEQIAVLATTLPISGLKDWVEAKKRLGKVAVISRAELVLLSRNEVRLNVHYIGDPTQLTLALAQADMSLLEDEGNWVLRLEKTQKRSGKKLTGGK